MWSADQADAIHPCVMLSCDQRDAFASDSEMMSQLEQASEAAAKIYRRQAERRKMADSAQDKIDNVIKLRRRKSAKNAG